jgi:hypothetical protein
VTKTFALLILGVTAIGSGLLALRYGREDQLQRADSHPLWGWFTRPYRVLEQPWLAGTRMRYFRQIGWLLLILGLLVLAGLGRELAASMAAGAGAHGAV